MKIKFFEARSKFHVKNQAFGRKTSCRFFHEKCQAVKRKTQCRIFANKFTFERKGHCRILIKKQCRVVI